MGSDLHFSLDNLPARYRIQALQQLSGDVSKTHTVSDCSEGGKRRKRGVGSNLKKSAPVRMKKAKTEMSSAEECFNREILLGQGKYEALTLNLPGGTKYTPDFLFSHEGEIYLIEVKGSYKLPTHGRSVMAFKVACSLYPMFTFMFAEQCGKAWRIGSYRDGLEVNSIEGTATELHNMR